MASTVPTKLKDAGIAPFAHRAAQLEKVKPIISYWLRFYITQKIISKGLHLADDDCKSYTTDLLQKLEETKDAHPTEDALTDDVAAEAYCEQFALDIFNKADGAVRANKVTAQTVDTFRAAGTFLDLLSVWKDPLEADIATKSKYAKYHALRITKALKAGEDPNLSNPVQEPSPQAQSPTVQESNGPEDQVMRETATQPFQPYAESVPDTSAPSPRVSPLPPNIPSASAGYPTDPTNPSQFPSHRDVSPISAPPTSRKGSMESIGGGYFPRVNMPTFTADNAAPSLPTAPSVVDEPMTSPFGNVSMQSAPSAPDPQNFYQNQGFLAAQSPLPPQFQQQPDYSSRQPQISQTSQSSHSTQVPQQQSHAYPQQPPAAQPPPQHFPQPMSGATSAQEELLRTDEEAIMAAQKHAKWAISALNFEDVNTAVKELRVALNALGAR
ncbi:DUF605-domain-containing protein [Delitschia confertaspora ATCC 74209]|uniref:DUF605-domain-containing protein n=1 Tax=Delitschia confertaspora ATCC 74209 TaxID=1513339 RepID=A0A9P4JSF8_9PLEO|nr:DUF605-domain-containing protein [Delitschia confertaspora ATCC 74209]